jgi:hypothetical protein
MPAPMGTWNINANGATGILVLSASSIGGITGTVFGEPLTAVWDETSQILSFSRATAGGPAFAFEVYTGTLFQPYRTPNGFVAGEGVPLMLAGDFGRCATPGGPFGPFEEFGWFATSQTKFKEKEGKEGKDSKDHKDKDKDKEQKDHKEKEPADFPPLQASSQTGMASAMLMEGNASPEVRFATGRSFVQAEERPQVGAAALRASDD